MGRPIKKSFFGQTSQPGNQIIVNGIKWADGTTSTNGYIVKQTGFNSYIVSNNTKTEETFLVNAATTGALAAGQSFILATPFGGSALPVYKIQQFRVSLYNSNGTISSYSWSSVPATKAGEANLITGAGLAGRILTMVIDTAGSGYKTVPAVTFNGGGTGAAAHATLTNGAVSGLTIDTAGSGYTNGSVTIAAPAAAVTATGTAVLGSGIITSVTVGVGGGYYTSVPTVTVTGPGTGAVVVAVLTAGVVTSFTVSNGGTGYTTATISVAAPAAPVQATAHATISV